jgi:UDP-N-acetylglucosamine acyltransferase
MKIHSSAIIDPHVELGKDVEIGPYAIIKGRVRIGDGTRVGSHVVIGSEHGIVEMGSHNVISSGAVLGGPPQDLTYKNETTKLVIGNHNSIREFVTLNIGTKKGGGITRIADHCLLMAYTHVAHDCQIGNHVVIANNTQFAGHVIIEDHVKIGGMTGFNQFVRVGKHSFLAGDSAFNKDILPFSIAQGRYAVARATNSVGLERDGFPADEIESIYKAIRLILKGDRTMDEATEEIRTSCPKSENIDYLLNFIKNSERGIAR